MEVVLTEEDVVTESVNDSFFLVGLGIRKVFRRRRSVEMIAVDFERRGGG